MNSIVPKLSLVALATASSLPSFAQAQTQGGYWVRPGSNQATSDLEMSLVTGSHSWSYVEDVKNSYTGATTPRTVTGGNKLTNMYLRVNFDTNGAFYKAKHNFTATVKGLLEWKKSATPYAPAQDAPSVVPVRIKITLQATAMGAHGWTQTELPATFDLQTGVHTQRFITNSKGRQTVEAILLQPCKVQNGLLQLTPLTVTGSTDYPDSWPAKGSFYIGAIVEARVDNRYVTITRDGAINEIVESDGTVVYGDTIYEYWREVPSIIGTKRDYVENSFFFKSNYFGNWSSGWNNSPLWWWNPEGGRPSEYHIDDLFRNPEDNSQDNSEQFRSGLELNINDEWVGTGKSVLEKKLYFKAQDRNDNAVAHATYVLRIHEPVEKDSERFATLPPVKGPMFKQRADGGWELEVVWGNKSPGMYEIGVTKGHSKGWAITVGGEGGAELKFKKIAKPLGVNFNVQGEYGEQNYNETTSTVHMDKTIPTDNHYTYPVFVHTYNRHHVYFRHYTPAGEHILTVRNSPYPDDHPLHEMIYDKHVGSSYEWAPVQDRYVTPVPEYPNGPAVAISTEKPTTYAE